MSLPKSKQMLISIFCIALLWSRLLSILEDKVALNTVRKLQEFSECSPPDQEGILRIDEAKSILIAIGCGHKCG